MIGTAGSAQGYLYSEGLTFCCNSTGNPEKRSPPQSDWMDSMSFAENIDNFQTEYYQGPALRYTLNLPSTEAVTAFWCVTTPDGYLLQQGEAGYSDTKPYGPGNFIYHNYKITAWSQSQPARIDSKYSPSPRSASPTARPFDYVQCHNLGSVIKRTAACACGPCSSMYVNIMVGIVNCFTLFT